MEGLAETQRGAPLEIGGVWDEEREELVGVFEVPIPGLLSMLAQNDPNAEVIGLRDIPVDERPPVNVVRFSFRTMIAIGTFLAAFAVLVLWQWRRRREPPLDRRWVLATIVAAGPLAIVALEAGWITTEVGRQPWIAYDLMRTTEAVTDAPGLWIGFAVAGAIASGRVPASGDGDRLTSWTGPTSLLGGTLAVLVTAFLTAVFLTRDAAREGDTALAEQLRRRALATAVVTGVVALGGIGVLTSDAPTLTDGLTGRGAPLILLSAIGGGATIWSLWHRHDGRARIAAALSVVMVVLGWGVGQYPWLEVDEVTLADAAASPPVLWGLVIGFGVAVVVVVPSLVLLLYLVETGTLREPPFDPVAETEHGTSSAPQGS